MRWGLLSTVALLTFGAVASPVKEESSTSIAFAEQVSCEGSHFIVTVQRTDDVKEDSGSLIAEKVSNIVFDFKVDRETEALLINGYPLKLTPQHVQKMTFLAVVIPPEHPALPQIVESGSIKAPETIEALSKLERNGLVTADVDLFVTYEGDVRQLALRVQVLEVEGEVVIHRDVLIAQINLPQHHPAVQDPADYTPPRPEVPSDRGWFCRFFDWIKSLTQPCASQRAKEDGQHRRPHFSESQHHGGDYHRHRFHRPRHGFMKFIISVVIPVLIGAAAGVGIGILSVFIAEIVGGIILKVRGRRNGQYIGIADKEDEEDEMDDEALPVYEEGERAPEYSDEKQ